MKHIIIAFVILLISCNQKDDTQSKSKSSIQNDNCVLNISTESADNLILRNARQFNKTYSINDSCYLTFLDNLVIRSCDGKSQEKLLLLDSLYRISDGYVGEYFADIIGVGLFENCFDSLLKYISKNNLTSLLDLLTDSIEYNIAERYDKQTIIDRLNYYLKKEQNVAHKEIISSIIKTIK